MKLRPGLALFALLAAAGCETLSESYSIERMDEINDSGIHVYSDLMENPWDGSRYWQFRAANYAGYPFCVQAALKDVRFTNGHSMGYSHYIAPGETKDIGYVHAPADFGTTTRTWNPASDGSC
ncbi:putative lipoprotein [Hyphomonas neptunium ATCC 15444]|uniref:Putative lipoprotein n=2 Tax=Hyphomonas TaxID=85 RepID=Q0BWM6_HYPNA|nr:MULTISPECIES: hypothetical protein [Hyphomonas]ABI78020.1 putative lipoprotein [Hyphomonas neptunium ATCC 15444]KCZ91885.1 putative lipoprotein [Hyphomonas hirschiana VP5]